MSAKNDMELMEKLEGLDAQVWAKEWCRIAREIMEREGVGPEALRVVPAPITYAFDALIDEGWMIGWFANAIVMAQDVERRKYNKGRGDIVHVQKWLDGEREYAEGKWDPAVADEITPERYEEWVMQYLHRSIVLGPENPRGRQALMKALRTLQAMAESNVRQYGALPAPGKSTTEDLEEWLDA